MARKREDNLRPCEHKLTQEEQKKGGKASAEARRKKRDLKAAIETLLESDVKGKDGKILSGAEAIAVAQFRKALRGDDKAFRILGEYGGQKPVEKIAVAEVNEDVITEVENMVYSGKTKE